MIDIFFFYRRWLILKSTRPSPSTYGFPSTADGSADTVAFTILDGNVNSVWSVDSSTRKLSSAANVDYEARSSYTLLIRATDSDGLTGDGIFTININDVNEPPVYAEGASIARNIDENPSSVGLAVGVPILATDTDAGAAGILVYELLTSGNTNTAFRVDTSTGQLEVATTAAIDREVKSSYTLTLRAKDTTSSPVQTDTTVTVTVNDVNEPPTILSGACATNALTINEESAINTAIGDSPLAPLSLCVSDVDVGSSHTFTIQSSSTHRVADSTITNSNLGAGSVTTVTVTSQTINANSGVVIKQGGLDPNQALFPGRWVTEGTLVTTLPGAGVTSIKIYMIRGTFTTTDSLTFGDGLGAGKVTLNSGTGRFQVAVPDLNADTLPNIFIYTIQITDNGGLSITSDVKITINDINEPPEMPSAFDLIREVTEIAPTATPTVPSPGTFEGIVSDVTVVGSCEKFPPGGTMSTTCQIRPICALDQEGNTLVYSMITTGSPFSLADSSSPQAGCTFVRVSNFVTIDFESKPTWNLVIRAKESGTSELFAATATVVINVVDQNDTPVLADMTKTVGENSVSPTSVGSTITASDQDLTDTLTYVLLASGNTNTVFQVSATTSRSTQLQIASLGGTNNIGDMNSGIRSYTLSLQVTDDDTAGGGVTPLTATASIAVSIVEQNDSPIVIAATFSVNENSVPGTVVGTATATDADNTPTITQTLTFSLIGEGNIDSAFEINSATGQISVKTTAPLDFETRTSFNIEVQAQDNGAGTLSGSRVLVINLVNVNEVPNIDDATRTVDENVPAGTIVSGGSVTGTDIDAGQTLAYSIIACTPSCTTTDFVVNSESGIITTSKALNFEQQVNYQLTYRATDSDTSVPLTDDCIVNINVLNVNDAPIANDVDVRISEDTLPETQITLVTQSDEDVGSGETFSYALDTNMDNCWRFVVTDPTQWYHVDRPVETNGDLAMTFGVQSNPGTTVDIWFHRGIDKAGYKVQIDDSLKKIKIYECDASSGCNSVVETVVFTSVLSSYAQGDGVTFDFWITMNDNGSGLHEVQLGAGTVVGNNALIVKLVSNAVVTDSSEPLNLLNMVSVRGDAVDIEFNRVCTGSYGIVASNKFQINSANGKVTLKPGTTVDYEVKGIYAFVVKVTDSGALSSNAYVVVRVVDVNEQMSFTDNCASDVAATSCMSVPENSVATTAVGVHVGTDPDNHMTCTSSHPSFQAKVFADVNYGGASKEYQVSNSIGFCINRADISMATLKSVAIECGYEFNLYAAANCAGTPMSVHRSNIPNVGVVESVEIKRLINLDSQPPTFLVPAQTLTYAIASGNVGSIFGIDATTGAITLAKSDAVNHEDPVTLGVYDLVMSATDNGDPPITISTSVSVTITDVNESPSISLSTRSVRENEVATTNVGTAIAATDPDVSNEPFGTLSYSIVPACTTPVAGICSFAGPFTYAAAATYCNDVKGGSIATVLQAQTAYTAGFRFDWAWVDGGASVFQIREGAAGGWGSPLENQAHLGAVTGTLHTIEADARAACVADLNCKGVSFKFADGGTGSGVTGTYYTFTNGIGPYTNWRTWLYDRASVGINAQTTDSVQVWPVLCSSDVDSANFAVDSNTGQISTVAILNFELIKDFSVILRVVDGGTPTGLFAEAPVFITVINVNEQPSLAPDAIDRARDIFENSPRTTKVGIVIPATDPDNIQLGSHALEEQQLLYRLFNADSSTSDEFKIGACSGQIEVKQNDLLDYETTITYSLKLTVTDDGLDPPLLSDQATITITVLDVNEPPVLINSARTINENSALDALVGAVVVATDPDTRAPQTLTYAIVGGNDLGLFKVVAATGQIQVATAAIDFESQSVFTLSYTATDNGTPPTTSTATVTITVIDINENPILNDRTGTNALSIPEETAGRASVGSPVVGTDPDNADVGTSPQTLSYSLLSGETSVFTLDSSTGQLNVKDGAVLDFEAKHTYDFVIRASDDGSPIKTDDAAVRVNIIDLNEAPIIEATTTLTVNENSGTGVTIGAALTHSDPDNVDAASQSPLDTFIFTITSGDTDNIFQIHPNNGQIEVRLSNRLNFEGVASYTLGVKITDNGNLFDDGTVTINLLDVNEAPTINDYSRVVAENTASGTGLDQDILGTCDACPVTGSDVDAGDTLTYSITGGDDTFFDIVSSNAILSVQTTNSLNYEVKNAYFLLVTVTDAANPSIHSALGTGSLTAQATISIEIIDVNEAPLLAARTIVVGERSDVGTQVGSPIQGTDVDIGAPGGTDGLTYSITAGNTHNTDGTSTAAFAIDAASGQLTVHAKTVTGATGASCDNSNTVNCMLLFDNTKSIAPYKYALTVRVADLAGLANTGTITVNVVDTNFAPKLASATFNLPENSEVATVVGTAVGTDSDTAPVQTLTYSITSSTPNSGLDRFQIDASTGAITIKNNDVVAAPIYSNLNHESTSSYSLVVTVTDNGSNPASGSADLSGSNTIIIHITEVNERAVLSSVQGLGGTNSGNDARSILELSAGDTKVGGIITAIDPDLLGTSNANLAYSLASLDGTTHPFKVETISNLHAQILVSGSTTDFQGNFEVKSKYTLKLTATDQAGAGLVVSTNVDVLIINVNEPPILPPKTCVIDENSNINTLICEIISTDPDNTVAESVAGRPPSFAIVKGNIDSALSVRSKVGAINTMEIFVTNALDWEITNSYSLTVEITDGGVLGDENTITTSTSNIIINLNDLNDVNVVSFKGAVLHTTNGGNEVILVGNNMGPIDSGTTHVTVVSATFGLVGTEYTATNCRVTKQNTEVTCVVPEAGDPSKLSSVGLKWILTVVSVDGVAKNHVTTSTAVTSYLPPVITAVTGADTLSTTGGENIVLTGTNFGDTSSSIYVSYGPIGMETMYAAKDCVVTVAHTEATCKSVEGYGKDMSFQITVLRQSSVLTLYSYGYGVPVITAVTGPTPGNTKVLNTKGGDIIIITGSNFGRKRSTTAPGSANGVQVPGSTFATLGRDDVAIFYGRTTGYENRMIFCDVVEHHIKMECTTAPGVGINHKLLAAIGNQISAVASELFNYKPPVLLTVTGPGSLDASTVGGQEVFITGDQLGPAIMGVDPVVAVSLEVTYGRDGLRYTAQGCRIMDDHIRVRCLTSPGVGRLHKWKLTVGAQISPFLEAFTSYAPPSIAEYTGDGAKDANTAGNQWVIIAGRNFGTVAEDQQYNTINNGSYIDSSGVTYNEKFVARNCHVHTDHVEINCTTTEGVGKDLVWTLFVEHQKSRVATTRYHVPVVNSIVDHPSDLPASDLAVTAGKTDGGQIVQLQGHNFGKAGMKYIETVSYGRSGIEYTAKNCIVESHTELKCEMAPGVGPNLVFQVSVQGQTSVLSTAVISYGKPSITRVSPPTARTNGGDVLRVDGFNFGLPDPTSYTLVRFHGQRLTPIRTLKSATPYDSGSGGLRYNHSVWFEVPQFPGMGLNKKIEIVTGTGSGGDEQISDPVLFSYLPPLVDQVSTFEGTRNGQVRLVIDGTNLGVSGTVSGAQPPVPCGTWNGNIADCQSSGAIATTVSLESTCGLDGNSVCWEHQQITTLFDGVCGCVKIEVSSGTDGQTTQWKSFIDFDPLVDQISSLTKLLSSTGRRRALISKTAQRRGLRSNTYGSNPIGLETKGGESITIYGRYMGTASIGITIGGAACINAAGSHELIPSTCDPSVSPGVFPGPPTGRTTCLSREQSIQCFTPPGQGMNSTNLVVISKGSQRSCGVKSANGLCNPLFLAYKPPRLTSKSINLLETSGTTVNFVGKDLGLSGTVYLNNVALPKSSVRWGSDHTTLSVDFPNGEGADHILRIEVSQQHDITCTSVCNLGYLAPSFTLITPNHGPTSAHNIITLAGRNFGVSKDSVSQIYSGSYTYAGPSVKIGGRFCNITEFTHVELKCKVPQGYGTDKEVVVMVQSQDSIFSSGALKYQYDKPVLTSIVPNNSPSSGLAARHGQRLNATATGLNFGSMEAKSVFKLLFGNEAVVDAARIISLTHTTVEFNIPPGQGADLQVHVEVDGRLATTNTNVKYTYDAPEMISFVAPVPASGPTSGCFEFESRSEWNTRLESYDQAALDINPDLIKRLCNKPATLTINGTSFGYRDLIATVGPYDSPTLYTSKGETNDCGVNGIGKLKGLCEHGHYEIKILSPVGFGTNHEVKLLVGGRGTIGNRLYYNFDPPSVEQAQPGSVGKGNPYMDALGGQSVSFSGTNFGGVNSSSSVFIDGVECINSKWQPADRDGFPFVQCTPQEMTVGPKNVTLTVALQTVHIVKRFGVVADRSLVSTICKSKTNLSTGTVQVYYGIDNEYCAPCPLGGVCDVETKRDPRSRPGYWLSWLNISSASELLLTDDFIRASEGKRCHSKRWDRKTFGSSAIVRDTCPDIIAW